MFFAVAIPVASAASPSVYRLGYRPESGYRATFARPAVGTTPNRFVNAQIYMERANGSAVWHIRTGRQLNQSATTDFLPSTNMVLINHSGWFS